MLKNNLLYKFDFALTTVLGTGCLPKMPGTWGSLVALLFLFVPEYYRMQVFIPAFVVLFMISIFSIKRMEEKFGDDPGMIVIDEVLGMLLIFMLPFVTYDWFFGILAFIVFRMFDISKPFPINMLNNKKGSFYVIVDDLIAGMYSWVVLMLLYKMASIFSFLKILEKLI